MSERKHGGDTATVEGIALSVAQLRARIEQRRNAAWQPEPGSTVQERRRHWAGRGGATRT